jgi:hypothetical protein
MVPGRGTTAFHIPSPAIVVVPAATNTVEKIAVLRTDTLMDLNIRSERLFDGQIDASLY